MNVSTLIARSTLVCGVFGILLSAAAPSPLFGLPRGYREDFNGCAQTEDEADRKRCCKETYDDCVKECEELHGGDPSELISCTGECALAGNSCNKGEQIRSAIEWPGKPGLVIPWVVADGNQLVAEPGVRFEQSDHAVIIEMRNEIDGGRSCIAIVAMCRCPRNRKGDAGDGWICRLIIESQQAQCRICPPGSGSEKCMPCPDCAPVVLSVQPCDVPALDSALDSPRGEKPENTKGKGDR